MKKMKSKQIKELAVAAIEMGDLQPRKFFDENALLDLASSLKDKSLLQPIIVRPKNGGYEVIMGARRLKAAQLAGFRKCPAFVVETLSDSEALEVALTENLQREDLTPFEEGWAILRLMKEFGYSIEDVKRKLNKGYTFIRSRIDLLQLPKEIQQFVYEGSMSIESATNLTKLDTAEKQVEAAQDIVKRTLDRKQAKEMIMEETERQARGSGKRRRRSKGAKQVGQSKIFLQVKRLQDSLQDINLEEISLPTRDELKTKLNLLKNQIDKIVREMDDMT